MISPHRRCRNVRPNDKTHDQMTPREIVSELDQYIVGQAKAKRAVAIALRNRWRRQQVPEDLRDEIAPKNIIMIGPTGVGKTEIAAPPGQARAGALRQGRGLEVHRGRLRRSRRRVDGPGPGRASHRHGARRRNRRRSSSARRELAEERLLDLLPSDRSQRRYGRSATGETPEREEPAATREKLRRMLREGKLDDAQRGDRDRPTAVDADGRDVLAAGHGGDGLQPQGHVREPHAEENQEAAGEGSRSAGGPDAGRGRASSSTWTSWPKRRSARVEQIRHHLHRRNRQDRRPRGRQRPRRLARGRAARPAAHRRGLDRQHQVRHGPHRSHPVHRRRRLSHVASRPT